MRIISGTARGTKLYTLEGETTRPTLDRVKESLFNIIQNKIQDSVFLDLFSGSGAIGLEAASRGAKKVILCDKSKDAIKIIKNNTQKTHLERKIIISNKDFKDLLKSDIKKIDIIYIDPPYKTNLIFESLEIIIENNILKEDGLIILETDEIDRILKQINKLKLEVIDKRKYGRAYLIFLEEIR
ncbi:MAG: 16S rRNA (guanine(966)-N(2))-methyltransferase RsmD [Clostridia bacterium]|nr:16S rRNA (guanine(966)-N(2))-methyltransferase RsmD [Clostridia bacterium]